MKIIFEGIDGAGKSTQAEALVEWCRRKGRTATVLRQPSESPAGKFIRRILQGEYGALPSEETLNYLFQADREICYEEERKLLADGHVVISDRSWISGAAYQATEMSQNLKMLCDFNASAPPADLVIYLEISVQEAMRRIKARDEHKELFENSEILERVSAHYKSVLNKLSETHRVVTIAAGSRYPSQVFNDVLTVCQTVFEHDS